MKGKLTSTLKACAVITLAAVSVSAFACGDDVYVGNPNRPDTIWIPGHCGEGCWHSGYYMKYVNPPVTCRDVYWQQGQYDRNGNYIDAHWQPIRYTVVGRY